MRLVIRGADREGRSLFVAECSFEERALPKAAGLRWHGGNCRGRCAACDASVGKVWWTTDCALASRLAEYADDFARALIAQHRERVAASRATDADIELPVPDGLAYMPFQKAGIAFALGRRGTLFGDEMGLGKTVEAIGVVNADPSIEKVLVICPATLRANWRRELERWLVRPRRVQIPESAGGVLDREFAPVVVINYDKLIGKPGEAMLRVLGAERWDLIVCDECHYLKNNKAQRTVAVLGGRLRKGDPKTPGLVERASRVLMLTGTPILNRPIELHPILEALAPDAFPFWQYARRYCGAVETRFGWDMSGASHLDELQERLRGTVMVRRLKIEVLTELPAKRRQVVVLPAEGEAARAVQREAAAWAKSEERIAVLQAESEVAHAGGDQAAYEAAVAALRKETGVAFSEMSRVRHETAVAKIPAVLDHLDGALEAVSKVIVFAHHHDVVHAIAEHFGSSAVTITGETKMEDRQGVVDRFQVDPGVRVFIGGITAAGVGLTLTAASTVVFAELDWVPANVTQAEDRAHRIGQLESVLVQHLVLDGSLDARMAEVIVAKQAIADAALDRAVDLKLPALPTERDRPARPKSYPAATPEQRAAAARAMRTIAGLCDGAAQRDGAGFSKVDVHVGHRLAELAGPLTDGEVWLACRLARKYRRQLDAELREVMQLDAKEEG